VPGFLTGQRYRSGNRFFAWYETRSPAVIDGWPSLAMLRSLLKQPGVLAIRRWRPAEAVRDTTESRLRRGGDRRAGPTTLIEGTDVASLKAALRRATLKTRYYPLRFTIG
jgi:hypothetical protein